MVNNIQTIQQHITGLATYDLKIGEFDHSDSGQMNMYLNYFKENELSYGDNPPIGIILCSGKNEALVKRTNKSNEIESIIDKYK